MADGKRGRHPEDDRSLTVIRKYANRRLYNTATSAFVTLEDLRQMVKDGEKFIVEDAKEGKDITPSILAQIIAEQEGRGESVLPGDLMRQLIAFYDSGTSESFVKYLQDSMDAFTKNWQSLEPYNEISRRNVDLCKKSYETFFGNIDPGTARTKSEDKTPAPTPEPQTQDGDDISDEVATLQKTLNDMQDKINNLRTKKPQRPSAKDED